MAYNCRVMLNRVILNEFTRFKTKYCGILSMFRGTAEKVDSIMIVGSRMLLTRYNDFLPNTRRGSNDISVAKLYDF